LANELELVVLVDDSVQGRNLLAEHGLSYWFRYRGKDYLFDTGQGQVLLANAKELNIDLKDLSAVFISHGHDDHTGGLNKILEINPEVDVYGHPDIFKQKFSGDLEIGIRTEREDIINFYPIKDISQPCSGIWMTGEVPRNSKFEGLSEKYKTIEGDKLKIDEFKDDQTLFVETDKGYVILLGCSHSGIVNIINYIKEFIQEKKIYAIIGGLHLLNASQERIDKSVEYLAELDFKYIMPLHCTGLKAVHTMLNNIPEKVRMAYVGDRFIF
jgi:7,8-dihydropterin-6-yl-methyl-4-(beta-D-ribofuranosyl)aminobenzene 5'-phosphate synthase